MKVSTPGRICLFGEHQDYLGLPVIAAAINLRVEVKGKFSKSKVVSLDLPNIEMVSFFNLMDTFNYSETRDYFKSSINVLKRHGFTFSFGLDCIINGNIPLNSGTSSSSALTVSWIGFLSRMADNPKELSAIEIGKLAYLAEVEEFNEAGGMMDHFSTACGNVIYLNSLPEVKVEFLRPKFGKFVLGDSHQPKDTVGILKRVKFGMLEILSKINKINPDFDLKKSNLLEANEYKDLLSKQEMMLLKGNIDDKDILIEALAVLRANELNHQKFGQLLNQHQYNLAVNKNISIPKIDKMIEAALQNGALGAKINGSGGGGCMFAYCPENADEVAKAIKKVGGTPHIIEIGDGIKYED